mgnify:CR=1 FL=1
MTMHKTLFDYAQTLHKALSHVDENIIELILKAILDTVNTGSNVYIVGNGGSLANASHIAGDYQKTFSILKIPPRIFSIGDNSCYITATSNDLDFSESFSLFLKQVLISNDTVIYLSGSGNSLNLVKAASIIAQQADIIQISVTAFTGGRLATLTNISLNINVSDMEVAEDVQLAIFHYIKQRICALYHKDYSLQQTKYLRRVSEDLIA